TTTYQQFICSFTSGTTNSTANIYVKKTGTTAETFYVDKVELYDTTGTKLTVGNPITGITGQLSFASSGNGSITLQAPPSVAGNYILSLPGESGTICTDNPNSVCSITGDAKYLRIDGGPNGSTTQTVNLSTVNGYLYNFTNSSDINNGYPNQAALFLVSSGTTNGTLKVQNNTTGGNAITIAGFGGNVNFTSCACIRTISVNAATNPNSNGSALKLSSADADLVDAAQAGNGGNLSLNAGTAANYWGNNITKNGGQISFTAGSANDVNSALSTSPTGSSLTLSGASYNGGSSDGLGGFNSSTSGGSLTLAGGGGGISLQDCSEFGCGTNGGKGGNVTIQGGTGIDGTNIIGSGGNVTLRGGNATSGPQGSIIVRPFANNASAFLIQNALGSSNLLSFDTTGSGDLTVGGSLSAASTILDGSSLTFGSASAATIQSASGKDLTVKANDGSGAIGGALNLKGGATSLNNSTGGTVSIIGGRASSNSCASCTGGAITIQGGNADGSSGSRIGGDVNIDAGSGSTDGTINIGTNHTAVVSIGSSGTSRIQLNALAYLNTDIDLTLASGTGQYSQTYTGTSLDAFSITANSLNTGNALNVTGQIQNSTNANSQVVQFNVTNRQGSAAVTGSNLISGVDLQYTQNPTVAGNVETALNVAIAANSTATTDSIVNSIINVANNDTATGNQQITATNGILINGANVTNGINLSGTFGTNLITSTNFSVTQAGAVNAIGVDANAGLLQGTAGLTITGAAVSLNASSNFATNINTGTSTGAVSIGNTTAAETVLIQGGNTSTALRLQTATGGTIGIGNNVAANTINIAAANGANNTTVAIGNGVTGSLNTASVTIGSNNAAASFLLLQGGNGTGANAAIRLIPNNSGDILIGGAAQTGAITVGQSTSNQTINIGTGITGSGNTLAIHIGDAGAAGSTTNITIGSAIAGTVTVKSAATFNKALTVGGHIISTNNSGSTTIAANANCGTGCSVNIAGNDTAGLITINTGTSAAAGTQASITFAAAYGVAPIVVITPATVPASSVYPLFHYTSATTTFDLKAYTALTDSKTYTFSYQIIQ
ncbi:S-layer family protein, partial [Candidatus Saccharibacteria bacterium]|nr:S-layer family protein [Candidatus Saccharibacteria bacterium]